MELELRKETYPCYDAMPQLSQTCEQSTETIVPDYCPDIARIVEGSGCLFLRSREITDGRVSVSGSLKVTLLYIAEGSSGVKSFEYTLPIEEVLDGRLREGYAELRLDGVLTSLDVRAVNPRKVMTRAAILLTLTPYASTQLTVCSEVAQQTEYGVETLCRTQDVSLIRALRSKDFVFSDEITLPASRPAATELLRESVCTRVTETRAVGSKLILKGLVCADILYLSEDGAICRTAAELPFSQIVEGSGETDETAEAEAFVRLTGAEFRLGGESLDDPRTISVKLFLSAFVLLRQSVTLHCITDLYSTSHELSAQTQALELSPAPQRLNHEQSVREQIETGVEVSDVLCADVSFGPVSMVREENAALLRVPANIRVLYLDESGAPLSVERRTDVSARVELPAGCTGCTCEVCARDVTAAVSSGGIEVRFPALFTLTCVCEKRCECLCALKAEPQQETDAPAPSLILRALHPGETLWALAKAYRTTVAEILSANELENEAAVADAQVLLIPRKR